MTQTLKKVITWLTLYEVGIICILMDSDGVCDTLFFGDFCDYDGFQYVVMCIFVPAMVAIISMWRKEISAFFKKLWYILSN